eukprot:9370037-Ditylum_brightwellii.AAC.1
MNDCLKQFLPRDNGAPQVKLVEDKLMDILENTVLKSWQGKMHRQRFNCATKWQAKFIQFFKCLELLGPPMQGQKGRQDATSVTGNWQQIPRKKRGQEANAPSLTDNQAHKKVAKFCLLHSKGRHTTSKFEVLWKQAKGLQSDKEKKSWSGSANGNGRQQHYSQQELNAIIGKSVKMALKKECKDCTQKEERNTINKFDALSLSSSNDDDISHT